MQNAYKIVVAESEGKNITLET